MMLGGLLGFALFTEFFGSDKLLSQAIEIECDLPQFVLAVEVRDLDRQLSLRDSDDMAFPIRVSGRVIDRAINVPRTRTMIVADRRDLKHPEQHIARRRDHFGHVTLDHQAPRAARRFHEHRFGKSAIAGAQGRTSS